jgi:hypothetical protein
MALREWLQIPSGILFSLTPFFGECIAGAKNETEDSPRAPNPVFCVNLRLFMLGQFNPIKYSFSIKQTVLAGMV